MVPGMWWAIIPACVFGMAQGLNIPSIQTMMAELAPMELRGAFMAINGAVLRIGQTLGPVVMGAAFAFGGLDGVFATAAVLSGATIIFAGFMIR
jgi:MFS family permease